MTILKKIHMYLLSFVLILGICFPPTDQRVHAATTPDDFGFIATIDKITGRINLLGLRPGIIVDTQVAFTSARIYGLTLSKLVRTEHGTMAITMKSSTPSSRIDVRWLEVKVNSMNIGGLCWPERLLDVCLSDITIDSSGIESSGIEIPNLVVETTYEPNEVAAIQAQQTLLDEQDDAEQLEKLLLALDEADGGPLSQQQEEYEQFKHDLPILEEQTEQLDEWMNEASEQKRQIDESMTTIEEILTEAEEALLETEAWDELFEQAREEQMTLETSWGEFTLTVEQATDLVTDIEEKLHGYETLVHLRSQYLEELELGDWSNSYNELLELTDRLNKIREKVDLHSEQLEVYHEEIERLQEQIDELALLLEEESERQQERMQQWLDAQEENNNAADDEREHEEVSDSEDLESQSDALLTKLLEFERHFTEVHDAYLETNMTPLLELIYDQQWLQAHEKLMQMQEEETFIKLYDFIEQVTERIEHYEKELKGLRSEVDKFAEQTEIDVAHTLIMTNIDKMTSVVDDIQQQLGEFRTTLDTLLEYEEQLQFSLPVVRKIVAILKEED